MLSDLHGLYQMIYPKVRSRVLKRVNAVRGPKVKRILADPAPPRHDRAEAEFDRLQKTYPPMPAYGYDATGNWRRAVERSGQLMHHKLGMQPGCEVLEVACGDGMLGHLWSAYGHRVTLQDLLDTRDERVQHLPFVSGDLTKDLPLDSDRYDLIYSYNAFEHIYDPPAALKQLIRVCKPGGHIFLDFGPLYCSAWGLHEYRRIRAPYPQYLFSEDFLVKKLREIKPDWEGFPALNRWQYGQYRRMFDECGCEIVSQEIRRSFDDLKIILRYGEAFSGRGLKFEDVTTTAIQVTLRKPAGGAKQPQRESDLEPVVKAAMT